MVERYSYRRECENISHFTTFSNSNHHPSFSSTLLDAIYRSIDEGEDEMVIYREGMRKKCSDDANVRCGGFKSDEEMANFQRACMIEKWMEKKVTEKVVVRRKSVADFQTKKPRKDRENSSWSSSDSSGGGFFSSSETESFPARRMKPIRTGIEQDKHRDYEFNRRESEQKQTKSEGGFSKTKLRALKIYGDLKKVKQPISPGGKLAGFLNSLFSGEKMKKPKTAGSDDSPSLKSTNASTCSSASSFSRSCLSKTPSSRGKPSTATKRSVRFSPVSVIVDEDCRPCGHKSLHSEINNNDSSKNYSNVNIIRNAINEELMAHVMEKNRRVEEVARDLLRNCQRKNQNQVFVRDFDEEEEDDDAASCASSDLFELDNLSAIGMERYREELPVYESTHIDATVAKGLIF